MFIVAFGDLGFSDCGGVKKTCTSLQGIVWGFRTHGLGCRLALQVGGFSVLGFRLQLELFMFFVKSKGGLFAKGELWRFWY